MQKEIFLTFFLNPWRIKYCVVDFVQNNIKEKVTTKNQDTIFLRIKLRVLVFETFKNLGIDVKNTRKESETICRSCHSNLKTVKRGNEIKNQW